MRENVSKYLLYIYMTDQFFLTSMSHFVANVIFCTREILHFPGGNLSLIFLILFPRQIWISAAVIPLLLPLACWHVKRKWAEQIASTCQSWTINLITMALSWENSTGGKKVLIKSREIKENGNEKRDGEKREREKEIGRWIDGRCRISETTSLRDSWANNNH